MARKPRIIRPGVPHHVVLRGNNRRRLLTRGDHPMFLFFLWLALERTGCSLQGATLMSNHIHLLVTPRDEDDLSRFVKMLAQRYAQLRNEKRDGSGRLFQQPFFSTPVPDEQQLGIVTAYIHSNPVRAGIVDDARQYRWSTHALHAGHHLLEQRWSTMWTPSLWYESLGDTPWRRAERYLAVYGEFLRLNVEPEHVRDLKVIEADSTQRDHLLRRPNLLRARENVADYRVGSSGKIRQ